MLRDFENERKIRWKFFSFSTEESACILMMSIVDASLPTRYRLVQLVLDRLHIIMSLSAFGPSHLFFKVQTSRVDAISKQTERVMIPLLWQCFSSNSFQGLIWRYSSNFSTQIPNPYMNLISLGTWKFTDKMHQ